MVQEVIIIFAALAFGGFVKGATGAGMPVAAIPVLASFFGVPFAIAIMIVPVIVTNVMQMVQFRSEWPAVGWLRWMWLLAGLGIVIGTWLLTTVPEAGLNVALATVVLIYVVLRLAKPDWHVPAAMARRVAPAVGFVSGMLQGATGISAPISITFLTSIRLTRPQFVFAVSTLFVTYAAVQLPSLIVAGILTFERAAYSTAALVPVLIAMPAGRWLAARLDQRGFDRLILILLAGIAVKLFAESGVFG